MKLSDKITKGFNKQINAEFYAAYLYLSASAYFESVNLKGFAGWMRKQSQEELTHAMKFYNHLVERDGRVALTSLPAPPTTWKNPLEAAKAAYEHEQKVTKMIHELVKMSESVDDYAANNLLQWFVDEQVEEEEQTRNMVRQLEMIKGSSNGLMMLDAQLGKRE